tara:strand:- start:411 stop:608 length:198 start_codon:yes stop_codon:yes gene_type:complete
MGKEDREKRVVAAIVSLVLLEYESAASITPSQGREGGSSWSVSHRRMATGKTPLIRARTVRSTKR